MLYCPIFLQHRLIFICFILKVFHFYFSCKSAQPICVLLTAALRRTVRDLRFNPPGNSERLKSSGVCLLECAVHMQAHLNAEGGWQEKRPVPSADRNVLLCSGGRIWVRRKWGRGRMGSLSCPHSDCLNLSHRILLHYGSGCSGAAHPVGACK